jgi:hypothetical protein
VPQSLFLQNVIAVVWDFDKTLTPGYMQAPLFGRFGIVESDFWKEVNALPGYYQKRGLQLVSKDTLYLDHILTYTREGIFAGLNNALLREIGGEIVFYEGLPDFFGQLRERLSQHDGARQHEIKLEHYVVSTGLREMIQGSAIATYLTGVWACEFLEDIAPARFLDAAEVEPVPPEERIIKQVGYAIDNTTKTRAIFEINKGTNFHPGIDVNSPIAPENRRVPFQNIIYVADGPSDVPVFSVVKSLGGRTYAVFKAGEERELRQVTELLEAGRVHAFGEADYRPGSQTAMWLTQQVIDMADRITADRARILESAVGHVPGHIV